MSTTDLTLRQLQEICFQNAEDKGFHERGTLILSSGDKEAINDYIGSRLLLVVSEVSEAQDELRAGHDHFEEYFSEVDGVAQKPEGFASEIADVIIRILDLAGELGIDIADTIDLKMRYNATRPRLHGKKF